MLTFTMTVNHKFSGSGKTDFDWKYACDSWHSSGSKIYVKDIHLPKSEKTIKLVSCPVAVLAGTQLLYPLGQTSMSQNYL